jgi:hypothetical protein
MRACPFGELKWLRVPIWPNGGTAICSTSTSDETLLTLATQAQLGGIHSVLEVK